MTSVERLHIDREATHDREALMAPHDAGLRRLRCELQRQRGGDQRSFALLEKLDEVRQHAAVLGELVAQRAAHREIVLDRLGERAHRSLPGHGSAKLDSAARSTVR